MGNGVLEGLGQPPPGARPERQRDPVRGGIRSPGQRRLARLRGPEGPPVIRVRHEPPRRRRRPRGPGPGARQRHLSNPRIPPRGERRNVVRLRSCNPGQRKAPVRRWRVSSSAETTVFRTCPLCEATCGLELTINQGAVTGIRGDEDDVFSRGFICPKGTTLGHLHDDPDRLRGPLVRRDGELRAASWQEAFAEVARRLPPIIQRHGRDAVAVYIGNPSVHNLSGMLYSRPLLRALGTRNVFSASTVDQRPKEISSALMFGTMVTHAVPDLDRTSYLLLLGANPFESNGSLATAPDWPGRLRGIRGRGGRVVVVDPKRTRTAEHASEHVPIRPGTDAQFLMATVHTLFAEGLVDLGDGVRDLVAGVDVVEGLARDFAPEAVAPLCGIDAATIRRLARALAAAPGAAVYGRTGTCTQEFGTVTSWLVDVLNVLTGNLDRPGGAMFAKPAAGAPNTLGGPRYGRETRIGRWRSRVRGLPESFGELPVACLAEEIGRAS